MVESKSWGRSNLNCCQNSQKVAFSAQLCYFLVREYLHIPNFVEGGRVRRKGRGLTMFTRAEEESINLLWTRAFHRVRLQWVSRCLANSFWYRHLSYLIDRVKAKVEAEISGAPCSSYYRVSQSSWIFWHPTFLWHGLTDQAHISGDQTRKRQVLIGV